MSLNAQTQGIRRLQRLSRLQALSLAAAEDAYRGASAQRDELDRHIDQVESRIAQAQQAMQNHARHSIAALQLMSEACDAQLVHLTTLSEDKRQADAVVDQTRSELLNERHRRDVLDDVIRDRRAAAAHLQATQLEQSINDLWLAGRRWT